MLLCEGFLVFSLTLLGLHLYRKSIPSFFPQLLREDPDTDLSVANGAGSVLWDVFLVFALYLLWYLNAGSAFLFVLLLSSLLFTILGWLDDVFDFSPRIKLSAQAGISCFCVTAYFLALGLPFSPYGFGLSIFLLTWLVNAVNFLDILDGLAGSVTLLLFLGFAVIFSKMHNAVFLALCGFWIVALIAFLTQNVHRPTVYLGDAGAHLLGSVLFFLGMELCRSLPGTKAGMTLLGLFGLLIFDFLFVCGVRFRKKQSLLLKSPDHLALQIFSKTGSKKKTLVLFCVFQGIANAVALFFFT